MIFRTVFLSAALGAALALPATSEAAILPIVPGGATTIDLSDALSGFGIGVSATGTAALSAGVLSLPVTGGSIDTTDCATIIQHVGSGLAIASLANPRFGFSVFDLVINTRAGTVTGHVPGEVSDALLFTFGTPGANGIPLLFSSTLQSFIFSFTLENVSAGTEVGVAATSPAVVPVPAALPLLLAGLGGLLLLRRGRAA